MKDSKLVIIDRDSFKEFLDPKAQELTEDTEIYRYMSLGQFIALLENKELYFRKVITWSDPWELPSYKLDLDYLEIQFKEGHSSAPKYRIPQRTLKESLEKFYAQCWTLENNSDAMWNIYSKDNNGVMIKTKVRNFNFLSKINQVCLGKIIYYREGECLRKILASKLNFEHSSFYGEEYINVYDVLLKRDCFKQEEEVRAIVHLSHYFMEENLKPKGNYLNIPFEPSEFIEEVILHPLMDDYLEKAIKKYCKSKLSYINIEKSNLYSDNFK